MLSIELYALFTISIMVTLFSQSNGAENTSIQVVYFSSIVGIMLVSLVLGIIGATKRHPMRKFAIWGIVFSLFAILLPFCYLDLTEAI